MIEVRRVWKCPSKVHYCTASRISAETRSQEAVFGASEGDMRQLTVKKMDLAADVECAASATWMQSIL